MLPQNRKSYDELEYVKIYGVLIDRRLLLFVVAISPVVMWILLFPAFSHILAIPHIEHITDIVANIIELWCMSILAIIQIIHTAINIPLALLTTILHIVSFIEKNVSNMLGLLLTTIDKLIECTITLTQIVLVMWCAHYIMFTYISNTQHHKHKNQKNNV